MFFFIHLHKLQFTYKLLSYYENTYHAGYYAMPISRFAGKLRPN